MPRGDTTTRACPTCEGRRAVFIEDDSQVFGRGEHVGTIQRCPKCKGSGRYRKRGRRG